MNQQKKRKHPESKGKMTNVKRMKYGAGKNVTEKIKEKTAESKKTLTHSNSEGKNNKNSVQEAKSVGKSIFKKRKSKQWQSIKEKRKRMKKKYLLQNKDKVVDGQNLTEDGKAAEPSSQVKLKEDNISLPKTQDQFSSNWKQLLKTKQIHHSKKKKKLHIQKTEKDKEEEIEKPDVWFDDVDEILLEKKPEIVKGQSEGLVKDASYTGLTRDVAMDCEMVGVGWEGKDSQLARVSIVNHYGHCVYDKYVKPKEKVTDYRTHVSGIRKSDLMKGELFEVIQREVDGILKDRMLIGHAVHNDLKVLYISHPKSMIRDTSRYKPFRQLFDGRNPSLKKLTAKVLGVSVQEGEHNSVQDAQATMRLYTMYRQQWEKELKAKQKIKKIHKKKKKK